MPGLGASRVLGRWSDRPDPRRATRTAPPAYPPGTSSRRARPIRSAAAKIRARAASPSRRTRRPAPRPSARRPLHASVSDSRSGAPVHRLARTAPGAGGPDGLTVKALRRPARRRRSTPRKEKPRVAAAAVAREGRGLAGNVLLARRSPRLPVEMQAGNDGTDVHRSNFPRAGIVASGCTARAGHRLAPVSMRHSLSSRSSRLRSRVKVHLPRLAAAGLRRLGRLLHARLVFLLHFQEARRRPQELSRPTRPGTIAPCRPGDPAPTRRGEVIVLSTLPGERSPGVRPRATSREKVRAARDPHGRARAVPAASARSSTRFIRRIQGSCVAACVDAGARFAQSPLMGPAEVPIPGGSMLSLEKGPTTC